MRRFILTAALALALGACGGVPGDARISVMDWTPDGSSVTTWVIAPDGEGRVELGGGFAREGEAPRRRVSRRFSVGEEGYREIRALLRSAEQYRDRGEVPCDGSPSSQAKSFVNYDSADGPDYRIEIGHGCNAGAARELLEKIAQGGARVREWTANAPEETER